jgi:hypothetical protein
MTVEGKGSLRQGVGALVWGARALVSPGDMKTLGRPCAGLTRLQSKPRTCAHGRRQPGERALAGTRIQAGASCTGGGSWAGDAAGGGAAVACRQSPQRVRGRGVARFVCANTGLDMGAREASCPMPRLLFLIGICRDCLRAKPSEPMALEQVFVTPCSSSDLGRDLLKRYRALQTPERAHVVSSLPPGPNLESEFSPGSRR